MKIEIKTIEKYVWEPPREERGCRENSLKEALSKYPEYAYSIPVLHLFIAMLAALASYLVLPYGSLPTPVEDLRLLAVLAGAVTTAFLPRCIPTAILFYLFKHRCLTKIIKYIVLREPDEETLIAMLRANPVLAERSDTRFWMAFKKEYSGLYRRVRARMEKELSAILHH